ncbi:MAG TPA: cytochrome c biogenesis protein ResB [Opitutaceae bacterium]|jgi:hypothetical protein|nr:cytochrome c biogenesis protein ResB [Opitutaceae bacterium]
MPPSVRQALRAVSSLRLTVALLSLGLLMIFAATLDQVNLGVWGVQQKYFHSFLVWGRVRGIALTVPVFPGGYLLGGLLIVNLVAAHFARFRLTAAKAGIWLTHVGLILLLVGEGVSGALQRDSQMRLNVGQTSRYSESFRDYELAITDPSDPRFDRVTSIPARQLALAKPIHSPALPFAVQTVAYFPNVRPAAGRGENDADVPAAELQFRGPQGVIGTAMVSAELAEPQSLSWKGRTWQVELRSARYYRPFRLSLLRFTHDVYPGSDIPKNFASTVRVVSDDGRDDRRVVISMNRPFRYRGLAIYQAGYANDDHTSVLEVVHNPAWPVPYLSCGLIGAGLVAQFGLQLAKFGRRSRRKS